VLAAVLVSISLSVFAQDVERFERIASLISENKTAEAEKQLTVILRSQPNQPVALNLMGTIRAMQHKLNEAETFFTRAVDANPQFTGARMNLAYLYLEKREPAKAVPQLREVLNLDSGNTQVMVVLGDRRC